MMPFLARCGRGAVAVFTREGTARGWHARWASELEETVVAEYLLTDYPGLPGLARAIAADWGGRLDGIIPWEESTMVLGAELGELLDLGWNSVEVIRRFRDKAVMKRRLRAATSLRINASATVNGAEDAVAFARDLGEWPLVVKPREGAGTTGVRVVDSVGELIQAYETLAAEGESDILIEEFIGGVEYAVNGIVDRDGDLLVTDMWRYDKRESHGYKNLYAQTIKVGTDDPLFRQLAAYAAEVVEGLELRRSPIHLEAKVDRRGPCLIEVAARLAGGNQPMLASKLHGRSLFELAACHYLAELPVSAGDLDYSHYDRLEARIVSGIQRFDIPEIREVHGLEEVEELASFEGMARIRPPGMPLPKTTDLDTKSYEVYLMHEDPRQIEADARAVRRLLWYE
jgi:hypothetical protein